MNKNVFISGASSGIGEACAEIFAENGYRIILNGRRPERLSALKENLESRFKAEVLVCAFNVADQATLKQSLDSLPAEWKEIDILVNNAGKALGLSSIFEGDSSQWDEMIDTNISGLLYLTRQLSPGMVQRKRGHIINIGSTAGKQAYPKGNVYAATKAAVASLTEGMRIDLLPYGIHVTLINPGAVETEFSQVRFSGDKEKAAKVYEGFQPLHARDIAETVYFAASRPAHVNIAEITVVPNAQASSLVFHKEVVK